MQGSAAPAPASAVPAQAATDLEGLVARIALYPDDLIAIILPAATNPLQLVQADRYLDKRKSDPKLPLDDRWDDSVKSLLNYPEVVKSMSADLDWTAALGEEVVEDQGAVLEAIQVFRRKTQSVGNLKTDAKQTVVVEKEVIKIVPSDPQVIYVPQYNPTTVVVSGGYSSYGYYPSPYPVYYYPYAPGAAFATGLIWGAAIGAAWTGGRYGANYGGGNNTINIDRSTNINTGGRGGGTASQLPARSGSGGSQWKSDKKPGQVSNTVGKTPSSRTGEGRPGGGSGAGGGRDGGGARASTQPAGGGRDFGGGSGSSTRASTQPSGGSAFGGSSASGRQTQMDSSRGASSRSSASSAASRPSPSAGARSGGGYSGGGGARAGGGGRGGRR